MEKNNNFDNNNNCKALMKEEDNEYELEDEEEFHEEFKCCVCLELLYKPVVLACGHMSCFWCVFNTMNIWHESSCPVCRHPYRHFPSICQLLHFLLTKLYPVAYKRRERLVGEEEKKNGQFSPQFDCYLFGPYPSKGFDILGKDPQGSYCSGEDTCKFATSSESFEAVAEATTEECSLHENVHEHKAPNQVSIDDISCSEIKRMPTEECSLCGNVLENRGPNQVSIDDLSCAACKRMLFRPVVLNCGHVYCESCIFIPEDGNFRCPVCQSLHPHGLPSVCLTLEHLLEEQFPELYAERRVALLKQTNCSTQAQQHAGPKTSSSKNAYATWWCINGPKVHVGVGCDFCGMSPIIGERYKCKDCVEKIGFDLCEACYKNPIKIPGRFNQQHKPEHKFEIVQPLNISDLLFRMNAEPSDDDGSDILEHPDSPQEPEDNNNDSEDA